MGSEMCIRDSSKCSSHKSVEERVVDNVLVYDSEIYNNAKAVQGEGIRQTNVRIRIPRVPAVGDKFSSRAGQKGTKSFAWPSQDMPLNKSEMTPVYSVQPQWIPQSNDNRNDGGNHVR